MQTKTEIMNTFVTLDSVYCYAPSMHDSPQPETMWLFTKYCPPNAKQTSPEALCHHACNKRYLNLNMLDDVTNRVLWSEEMLLTTLTGRLLQSVTASMFKTVSNGKLTDDRSAGYACTRS